MMRLSIVLGYCHDLFVFDAAVSHGCDELRGEDEAEKSLSIAWTTTRGSPLLKLACGERGEAVNQYFVPRS